MIADAEAGRVPGVRRIAVLRANAIGDFVFALPALDALRATYPAAEIVLLGQPWHAEFLCERPGPVDRVVVVPESRGVRGGDGAPASSAALDDFFARMREERFDLALQMHGGGRSSNPFVRRLGARLTAGLRADDAAPLDRSVPYVYFQPEIVRHLEVVALVGARPATLAPRLEVASRDLRAAAAVVPEGDAPLALLHPVATDPRRMWPAECFVDVGRALADAGAIVAVNGVASERTVCDAVCRGLSGALNLAGRLDLSGLAGLASRCAVVVGNDSGPLHLAAAVGTPTVGIYWSFNLVNCSELLRTKHRPFASWRTHCPVCGTDCTGPRCDHEVSFVADVPPEPVREAALQLLLGSASRPDAARGPSSPAARRSASTPRPS